MAEYRHISEFGMMKRFQPQLHLLVIRADIRPRFACLDHVIIRISRRPRPCRVDPGFGHYFGAGSTQIASLPAVLELWTAGR